MAFECLSSSFILVRIKFMHDRFSDWKQVGYFIKHLSNIFIQVENILRCFKLKLFKLKVPMSIVLSKTGKLAQQGFLTDYQRNISHFKILL